MRQLRIGSRLIGDGQPCFLIAEAGANHDGKFEDAIGLIDAAARAGADSIKFQHYTAGKLVSKDAMRYWLLRGEKYGSQFQPGSYSEDQRGTFAKIDGFPREKDEELMRHSESRGISMFSTPFDFESVDHLANLNVPAFKIASGDLTYHQFLAYVAKKGKPVLLSTGAASLDEIYGAVNVILKTGNDQIVLLHCTLCYPAPLEKANLLMMRHLQEEFPDVLIGLSDHTPGITADIAAAQLGAAVIEKHFTDTPGPIAGENKVGESPDHDMGISTEQFLEMSKKIRDDEINGRTVRIGWLIEAALASIQNSSSRLVLGSDYFKKVDELVELRARAQARRSVVTNVDLKTGTVITAEMLSNDTLLCKRPGTGIAPYDIQKLVGLVLKRDVEADRVLNWTDFNQS